MSYDKCYLFLVNILYFIFVVGARPSLLVSSHTSLCDHWAGSGWLQSSGISLRWSTRWLSGPGRRETSSNMGIVVREALASNMLVIESSTWTRVWSLQSSVEDGLHCSDASPGYVSEDVLGCAWDWRVIGAVTLSSFSGDEPVWHHSSWNQFKWFYYFTESFCRSITDDHFHLH